MCATHLVKEERLVTNHENRVFRVIHPIAVDGDALLGSGDAGKLSLALRAIHVASERLALDNREGTLETGKYATARFASAGTFTRGPRAPAAAAAASATLACTLLVGA
jgi:hypothetical protein